MKRFVHLVVLLALSSSAVALAEYTIVLKDGTRITAKEKPEVKGKFLNFQTPTGSPQRLTLTDVDEAKTEAANKGDLGGAQVLDTPGKEAPPTAAPAPAVKQRSISDLSRDRKIAAQKTAIAEATPVPGSATTVSAPPSGSTPIPPTPVPPPAKKKG